MSRDDYAFPCAGCLCDHCANNLYSSDQMAGEAKIFCYMQLNVDIDTKNIDLEEYVSMQKKSIAGMCNVPEEKVIPISRLEYETYTDE